MCAPCTGRRTKLPGPQCALGHLLPQCAAAPGALLWAREGRGRCRFWKRPGNVPLLWSLWHVLCACATVWSGLVWGLRLGLKDTEGGSARAEEAAWAWRTQLRRDTGVWVRKDPRAFRGDAAWGLRLQEVG